jgi:hypothetical protein
MSSQAEVWYNKEYNGTNPEVARLINQAPRPLLISDAQMADILSLSYLLNPKVQLLLKPRCYTCNVDSQPSHKPYIPEIPNGFSDVFLFHPRHSDKWLDELKQVDTYKMEPLVSNITEPYDNLLWRL